MQFIVQIFFAFMAAMLFAAITMALYAASWLFGVNFTSNGWITSSLIGAIFGLLVNLYGVFTNEMEDRLPSIFGWMAAVAIIVAIYCRLYGVY